MRRTSPPPSDGRFDHLLAAAREAGVTLTHQRMEIIRELAGTEEHPDAKTLFRAVQRRVPTVSLDTVYRTLWRLHDLGLVETLGHERDGMRFDANLDRHHHYVCVECGLVRDFESDELDGLRIPEAVKRMGSVVDARVEVRGLCTKHTRAKEAAKRASTKGTPAGNRTRERSGS